MRRIKLLKKILGIVVALIGIIILIEIIPLWIWYSVLGILCIIFVLCLFKKI